MFSVFFRILTIVIVIILHTLLYLGMTYGQTVVVRHLTDRLKPDMRTLARFAYQESTQCKKSSTVSTAL